MLKFIKRTSQAIVALIVVGIVALFVYANSERLAYDMVYLSCTIKDANGMTQDDSRILPSVKRVQEETNYARLRKDWLQSKVLLNWIDYDGEHENGMEPTIRMNISVDKYSEFDWIDDETRTIDRETLLYRVEYGQKFWIERACVKTTKSNFERMRIQKSTEVKAKQKI